LLDGAHNAAGAQALAASLRDYAETDYRRERLLLCLGVLQDKEIDKITAALAPLADWIVVVKPDSPRAAWQETAVAVTALVGAEKVRLIEDPVAGARACLAAAGPRDLVCVTGSLYMLGAVRQELLL
jgi:dihydrofolate synthase/folylpolyglutamate synthase